MFAIKKMTTLFQRPNSMQRISQVLTRLMRPSSIFAITVSLLTAPALAQEVSFAGFAFAGDHATVQQRFPHTYRIEKSLAGVPSGQRLSQTVVARTYAESKPILQFAPPDKLASLKGSDQTMLSVLLLTGESVSTEQFGTYYKTFVSLRGEALVFDYKSKTIVRSYPISVAVFDAGEEAPDEQAIETLVRDLLLRADGGGLVSQYVKRMGAATLPSPATRTFQVRRATVGPEALSMLPAALRNDPGLAGQVMSDAFGAVLASKLGISLLPTGMGQALGVMSFRLDNGDAYDFKLGEGDYLFDLAINRFVKVKSGENAVGASFVYGVHGNIRFFEPALNTEYLRTDIKNGEVKLVPAGQLSLDDYPAYEAAMRGLFLKFAAALQPQPDMKWITTAAADKTIGKQLDSTRNILKASQ
jgi:hypothetical protein